MHGAVHVSMHVSSDAATRVAACAGQATFFSTQIVPRLQTLVTPCYTPAARWSDDVVNDIKALLSI